MNDLTENVLYYFEQICKIPHGSGNCHALASWLCEFGRSRGLDTHIDDHDNVLIRKPGVGEGASCAPVILQGHMDMVCTAVPGSDIDMKLDSLKLKRDGDIMYAEDTSLGADDGIGVAMMLAVLDDNDTDMAPIEAVFTTDEEVGMEGAADFDMSLLSGRMLINLDSEAEGEFTCGCAGGERVDFYFPMKAIKLDNLDVYTLRLYGLKGGHSGCDIDKNRQNAIKLLADIVYQISKELDVVLIDVLGGEFDNVICDEAVCRVAIPRDQSEKLCDIFTKASCETQKRLKGFEPDMAFDIVRGDSALDESSTVMAIENSSEFLKAVAEAPQGVVEMSGDFAGAVQTSLNLGIACVDGNSLSMTFLLRSSVNEQKALLERRLVTILTQVPGCTYSVRGTYPAWSFAPDSKLREKASALYEQMFGKPPVLTVTHGGLECGYFSSGINGVDCLSIGPQIDDIHSVREKISISSIDRTSRFLSELLKNLQ